MYALLAWDLHFSPSPPLLLFSMKASLAVLSAVGAVSAFPSFQLDPRQDDNGVRTDPLVPGISKNNHTCALSEAAESCTDGVSPETVDSCCVET